MKYIYFFIFITFSASCFTNTNDLDLFSIVSLENKYYLFENQSNQSIKLSTFNGSIPKLIKTTRRNSFILIHYNAGSSGTKELITHINVALYNIKTKTFDKIYPFKYIGLPREKQPILKISKDKVLFQDSF